MGASDLSEADFAALLELAEAKFQRWLRKEWLPERDRRINELKKQPLMFGGRVVHARRIYEELLAGEVRQRVGFYAEVARESGNPEMLSAYRLGEFRERIMTSVGHVCTALKENIEREARAAGNVSPAQLQALVSERLYVHLRARILDIANVELGVLEAEGNLSQPTRAATRRGYRAEIRAWMKAVGVKTNADAARRLAVSVDTLKSIMSTKGNKKYSDETRNSVLKKIGLLH